MGLIVSTSLPPNILSHIYTCSGLLGNVEYRKRFSWTVRKEDVSFLKNLEPHFRHRPPVAGGPLFTFLYQIPGYFPAENLEEILKTFDRILYGLANKSNIFRETDPPPAAKIEAWMPAEITAAPTVSFEPLLTELRSALRRLTEILSYTYRNFYMEYWERRKPVLLERAKEVQGTLKSYNIFEAWSKVLGVRFPYDEFVAYVDEARLGGTSLMAEKITIPFSTTLERASDIIIHEVGIHFISPRDYLRKGILPMTFLEKQEALSRMEEAAICYLKPKVYGRLGLVLSHDYHIPLMKIEKEIKRFEEAWESKTTDDLIDTILRATDLI